MDCFYSASGGIIDSIDHTTGLGIYSRKSFRSLQQEYPDLARMSFEDATERQNATHRTGVIPSNKEAFKEMLGTNDWICDGEGNESFQMLERTCGDITTIYAYVDGSYWKMSDSIDTPHETIVSWCRAERRRRNKAR